MSPKGKLNSTTKKYKIATFLRNGFRILFLIIFLHWILWLTSYANCVNYQEAISEKNVNKVSSRGGGKEEEKKLTSHDAKTDNYQCFTGWLNEKKEKDITEIEEDVLSQIEKKKGLTKNDDLRIWKKKKLPELEKLRQEVKKLEKEKPTKEEKEELEKKQKKYKEELEKAKEETVENIQTQLEEKKLNITELDDNRDWKQQILTDPLKFTVINPLNYTSKLFGLHSHLYLEIIFKLLIIEILLILLYYSETTTMWDNMEKARNPYLSVEEKDQLNVEAASLFKYFLFNGFMWMLFTFFLAYHPAFFDRTTPLFQSGTPGTEWWIWTPFIFISLFLAAISSESLHHGRLLTKPELKTYAMKTWVASLFGALISIGFMRLVGMSSIGQHLIVFLGGLVRFAVNMIRVYFFGHREHAGLGGMRNEPTEETHSK